jgi:hypothetical protein
VCSSCGEFGTGGEPYRACAPHWDLPFMRTLWLILQIILVPWLILNLYICMWGGVAVFGLIDADALFPLLLGLFFGIGAWGLNGAMVKILTEHTPAWVRLLWLPGSLFTVVVTFIYYAASLRERSATMLAWPSELFARMSPAQLAIAAALTLLTVGSPAAIIGLERLRKAKA